MNVYQAPRELPNVLQIARWWKTHWLLSAVLVAAITALGFYVSSALCAYTQGHCHYLVSATPLASQAGRA
jgi:hypothetical protein